MLGWMSDLGMHSLLPRGTKTYISGLHKTTIDLALVSKELAKQILKCHIHDVEHSSNHWAIVTLFIEPGEGGRPTLLFNFRRTDWEAVRKDLEVY